MIGATWDGMPVVPNDLLPIDPTPATDVRRYVRHALAARFTDFRQWAGDIGPKPGEPTTCLVIDGRMHVAPTIYGQLRVGVGQPDTKPKPEPVAVGVSAWLQRRMCSGKVRHPTHDAAVVAAARRVTARKVNLLRVYECPLCSGFHLTSKPAKADA